MKWVESLKRRRTTYKGDGYIHTLFGSGQIELVDRLIAIAEGANEQWLYCCICNALFEGDGRYHKETCPYHEEWKP